MQMTVKQLKITLNRLPDDLLVFVEGYEGGLSNISIVKETKVDLNVHKEEWMGPHDENPEGRIGAIVLCRESGALKTD